MLKKTFVWLLIFGFCLSTSNLAFASVLDFWSFTIDPGHGGTDAGAVGPTGLKEKEVNLAVANILKRSALR